MASREYFADVDEESGSQLSDLQKRRLLDPDTSDSEEENPYFNSEEKELASTDYSFHRKVNISTIVCSIEKEPKITRKSYRTLIGYPWDLYPF